MNAGIKIWIKRSLMALAVLLALLALIVTYVVLTFDANAFKTQAVQYVVEHYQRTLVIDGDIGLTVFPRIGVSLGHLSLSEPRTSSIAVEVEKVKLSLDVLPLLRREVRVGAVELAGLRATLVRDGLGKTNFDDLVGDKVQGKDAAKQVDAASSVPVPSVFDVEQIRISKSSFTYRDKAANHGAGSEYSLSGLDVRLGRLANATPVPIELSVQISSTAPVLKGQLTAKGAVNLDVATRRLGMRDFEMRFEGQMHETNAADAKVVASLSVPQLELTGERAAAKSIRLQFSRGGAAAAQASVLLEDVSGAPAQVRVAALSVEASSSGAQAVKLTLKSPLEVNLDALAATLVKMDGRVSVQAPDGSGKTIDVPFSGRVGVEGKAEKADAAINAQVEGSPLALRLDVAGFDQPRISFNVEADKIDLDHFMKLGGGSPGSPGSAAPSAAKEVPFDLTPLKTLNLDGNMRIGQLKAHGVQVQKFALTVHAHAGELVAAPITALLYEGSVDARASVNANSYRYAFAPRLTNISIGPLLRDAAGIDKLEGRGNVSADLTASGNTLSAIKRSLNGNAAVRLADGVLKGFDYAKQLGNWRDKLRGAASQSSASDKQEQTAFSEMGATFQIVNGIATNKDLLAKAPLLRLDGAGQIDIAAGSIDYLVKASLVSTLTGQGGKNKSEVYDVTVPVKLAGTFEAPRYEVQWAGIASQAIKAKAVEAVKGKLGDALKGLLQR
jgi:AsmA protein